MSIPNILTTIRLCMMPVFLVVYFLPAPNAKWWAMGVIIFAFLTDVLDGYIARHYHQITDLGKILDPIADKVMQLTVLICIAINDRALLWAVLFLLFKEILLGIGALIMYRKGVVGQSNWFGKVACFVSILVSIFLLVPFSPPLAPIWKFISVTLLVGVNAVALISYAVTFFRVLHAPRQ